MAWAASFFFWMAEALLRVTLHISSLPANPPNPTSASGRKKRTAVQQIPNQNPRKQLHRTQSRTKEKQAHQSQQAPQAHSSESQDQSNKSHQDHSSPSLLHDRNVKGPNRNRIDTPSFNSHRFVLFCLLFTFPLSLHLSSVFLSSLLSSLPTRFSLSQLLKKFYS